MVESDLESRNFFINTRHWLALIGIAVGVGIVAYVCAWVIEVPVLKYGFRLPYDLRIPLLTPIIEESLKILPFLVSAYFLHRYWREKLIPWRRIMGLGVVGGVFGFLEGVFSHHAGGASLLLDILIHTSMTGFSGFFTAGIFTSILLHIATNSVPGEFLANWRLLVILSFFIACILQWGLGFVGARNARA